MNKNPLEISAIKTLCYFDLFDYPLTKEELFAYLYQPPALSFFEFVSALPLFAVEEKDGFYFLPGRGEITGRRARESEMSDRKMDIARRAAQKILSVPFLRAIFVCNSVGAGQAEDGSDIDFFIICASGRLWIVRFFSNLILRLCRLRTYGAKIKNRVCLSFYIGESDLDLAGLRTIEDDIHFAYWIRQMIPIFDPFHWHGKFLEKNIWIKKYLPHGDFLRSDDYIFGAKQSAFGGQWQKAWEKMWNGVYGGILESQAKNWQLLKMRLSLKEKAQKGDHGVVLSDGAIKLHENDRRLSYREAWRKKL